MATEFNGSIYDGVIADILNDPNAQVNKIPKDSQWIMQAFVVSADSITERNKLNRQFSTAGISYQDSSIGGNNVINPPPQFTRYADIPMTGVNIAGKYRSVLPMGVKNSVAYTGGNPGIGRFWHEAFDQNKQVVHLRFGVPEYNSLIQFLTGFYSSSAGNLARTGRVDTSLLTDFLELTGKIIGLAIFPMAILPMAAMMAGTAVRWLMKWPASKFYYLRPAMPLYWNAVTSMVNQIGVNMGVIRGPFSPDQLQMAPGERAYLSQNDYSIFSSLLPEFSTSGQVDIYALANKTKRLQSRYEAKMREAFTGNASSDFYEILLTVFDDPDPQTKDARNKGYDRPLSLEAFWQAWIDTPVLSKVGEALGLVEQSPRINKDAEAAAKAAKENGGIPTYTPMYPEDSFSTFLNAEMADGSQYASFAVDAISSVSESFSSSTARNSLGEKINSISSSARELRINLAGGNIDPFGVTSTIAEGVSSVLSGAASMLGVGGGFAAFAGSCFVDIPQYWENAQAQLPKANYTLSLVSPYNNPVSQFLYIYVPLAMLLAGALPLATGKQSYTAPFLCECVCRGIQTTRLGIIDNLSITRGTTSLPFTRTGNPLGIDVSFTVLDLSTIVAMPIQPGFKVFEGLFDTDNAFSDYLMTLSGMSVADTVANRAALLSYSFNRKIADVKSFFSASHIAQYVGNLPPLQAVGAILSRGTNRV